MATLEQLRAKMKKLRCASGRTHCEAVVAVIDKMRELTSKHGLTIADIDVHVGGKKREHKLSVSATTAVRTKANAASQ
ncbi:hypothetical protein [Paraburkholderia sp. BL10I2N1]|uniref:hypothetical protein n=1 Tax=Paraburkholderia sp. BL10I2N1 TaxID=1938796 RepID=UPI001414DD6C|nr:hypothetical protein [Paraburkholderia sp. BL10I2N1]